MVIPSCVPEAWSCHESRMQVWGQMTYNTQDMRRVHEVLNGRRAINMIIIDTLLTQSMADACDFSSKPQNCNLLAEGLWSNCSSTLCSHTLGSC